MKLSVMTLPLLPMPDIPGLSRGKSQGPKPTLTEIYAQVKAAGADAVDVSTIDFQFGGEEGVLRALKENDLKCSCYLAFISAPKATEEGNRRAVEQGKAAVDQTLRLGTRIMMFVPADYQDAVDSLSREAVAATFAEVLRPVVRYAEEKGVTVVIEDAPHRNFPMCSEAELKYLLEAVPGLKLVYDSGNMLHAGEDPVVYYDHLAEYTAHAHGKEVGRGPDGTLMECPHGEGMVDFKTLFSHMRENDFNGYIAIELAPDFSGGKGIRERVQDAINYLTPLI